jgi:hypothetical protein
MNDEELVSAVRRSVADVRMGVPAGQVAGRGRAIRSRRVMRGAALALALAAGLAVAVAALVPSGRPGSDQAAAGLPAWTVVRQSDGSISITIRQLRDPAGLQGTLRGDGLPAVVVGLGGQPPAGCRDYPPVSRALASSIFRPQRPGARAGGTVLVIDPSALPGGAGVQLAPTVSAGRIHVSIDLVYATAQCTG